MKRFLLPLMALALIGPASSAFAGQLYNMLADEHTHQPSVVRSVQTQTAPTPVATTASYARYNTSRYDGCVHSSHNFNGGSGYRECNGRVRPYRPFQRGIGGSRATRSTYALATNGVLKTNSNVIGWSNSSYAQQPWKYSRNVVLSAQQKRAKIAAQGGGNSNFRHVNTKFASHYAIQQNSYVPRHDWAENATVGDVHNYVNYRANQYRDTQSRAITVY